MNSIDFKEYQELKQRLRRTGNRKKPLRRYSLIVAIIAVFQLGIAGGIILSGKFPKKGTSPAHQEVVRQPEQIKPPPPVNKVLPSQQANLLPKTPVKPDREESRAKRKKAAEEMTPVGHRQAREKRYRSAISTTMGSMRAPISIDVAGGDIGRAYAAGMRTIIERHKETSPVVNGLPAEGRSVIVCIIKRDGSLRHAEIVRSSGNGHVDAAALRSVHKAGRFPQVPENIPGDEFSFDVPLTFKTNSVRVNIFDNGEWKKRSQK